MSRRERMLNGSADTHDPTSVLEDFMFMLRFTNMNLNHQIFASTY